MSNYELLGKHIKMIDARNTESITDRVLGINIDKFFMPSVANVIGTDLSKYKLLTKGVFACNPMHVGRDERLPIALYSEDDPAIVSPAYYMFIVRDESVLDRDYLMMWFRRPEFDRVCWLKTDGSVRGGLSWDDLCRMEIPVPSIDKQKHIVEMYNAITKRIELKRRINDNLEDIAHSIYRDTISDSELEAKPIKHFGTVITGKTPSTDCLEYYGNDIPFIKTPDMHGTPFVTTTECYLSKLGAESQTNKYIPEFSLIVACIGANAGEVAITTYQAQTNQQINAAITDYPCTLYFAIKDAREELRALGDGSSTMLNINKSSFENFELLLPCKEEIVKLECLLRSVFDYIHFNVLEINLLEEYKALLVATLSR